MLILMLLKAVASAKTHSAFLALVSVQFFELWKHSFKIDTLFVSMLWFFRLCFIIFSGCNNRSCLLWGETLPFDLPVIEARIIWQWCYFLNKTLRWIVVVILGRWRLIVWGVNGGIKVKIIWFDLLRIFLSWEPSFLWGLPIRSWRKVAIDLFGSHIELIGIMGFNFGDGLRLAEGVDVDTSFSH